MLDSVALDDEMIINSEESYNNSNIYFIQSMLYNINNDKARKNVKLEFTAKIFNNVQDNNMIIDNLTVNVLFDTGALCSNYINMDTYKKIKKNISSNDIKYIKSRTGTADDVTIMQSDITVTLTLDIQGRATNMKYRGDFVVLEMKSNEVIVGLPTILGELWEFFKTNVEEPKETPRYQIMKRTNNEFEKQLMLNFIEDAMNPWQNYDNSLQQECKEEKNSPLPTSFGDISEFLGKTRDEALKEFESMFDEHICSKFRAAVPIDKLLKTKGAEVFVPQKWQGITGIEPLEIKFRDTLPVRLKPKARPINPRLYEATEREFM